MTIRKNPGEKGWIYRWFFFWDSKSQSNYYCNGISQSIYQIEYLPIHQGTHIEASLVFIESAINFCMVFISLGVK